MNWANQGLPRQGVKRADCLLETTTSIKGSGRTYCLKLQKLLYHRWCRFYCSLSPVQHSSTHGTKKPSKFLINHCLCIIHLYLVSPWSVVIVIPFCGRENDMFAEVSMKGIFVLSLLIQPVWSPQICGLSGLVWLWILSKRVGHHFQFWFRGGD